MDYAERAVACDPGNSEYHHWLGKAYGLRADKTRSFGSARKCRHEFEKAVGLSGANLPARRDLLEFYLEAPWFLGGGKEKAWQQALAISEVDRIEGFLARGFYWETVKDPRRAEAEYTQVIELRPARIEPYFEVVEFYQHQENASRMRAVLETAARIDTQDVRWAYYRAVAGILAHKKLPEAEQELRAYLASPPRLDFPSHASAREWLGRLYEESGRPQLAMGEYGAALQLDPDRKASVEALKRLGKTK
jgi:tetratricopeptide (TPR) repeat protein